MKRALCLLLLVSVASVVGCTGEKVVRVGFMGGLSDRGSDVGEGARNGVLLATEQRNARGGIKGYRVEVVVQDDRQKADEAVKAIHSLIETKVAAIVGPITSDMAAVTVPISTAARLVMISPTVTGADFVAKDDFLIRVNRSVYDNAKDYAQHMHQRGLRKVAVAYDLSNRSFSETWLKAYASELATLGGKVVEAIPFESQKSPVFSEVIQQLSARKPDGYLFIATAVDTARLAQQSRKLTPAMPMATAEWASTEVLLEVGGAAVEGMLVSQPFNRDDRTEKFQSFLKQYVERFGHTPGFSAVNAYDAANVLFDAMIQKQEDEDLKSALIRYGPYAGLQQSISFDRYGDTPRQAHFTEIRQGRFVMLK